MAKGSQGIGANLKRGIVGKQGERVRLKEARGTLN